MRKHNFEFNVDVNVINHLGVGLYSSTPAALTELVANAWDADAKNVTITVDPASKSIVIEDDGHGMSAADIKSKFLKVGYSRRRTTKGAFSNSGARRVMGRKGIGKLAIFALAENVKISSQAAAGDPVGLIIEVPEFKRSIELNQPHPLQEFDPPVFTAGHGTRIELTNVLTGLQTTEGYLRVKLARRFSVLDDGSEFNVRLNGSAITKQDRGFYNHVQFLWCFDDATKKEIFPLATSLDHIEAEDGKGGTVREPCIAYLYDAVNLAGVEFKVRGYVASVFLPKQLGSKEDSANMLSIFANGRVFAENILAEANSAKYYQNYLVGEIHADWLDDDDVDRATASREAIKKDDPKYQALLAFARSTLESIGDQWDSWRVEMGMGDTEPQNAAVVEWINSLTDKRDQKTANKLMTSIKNAVIHSDEDKNAKAKLVLYRGAIIGFEKLRLRNQLDKLHAVGDVLGVEFAAIFASLDQVEESSYAEITRQRLEIIKKFAAITNDPGTLEKVAQKYLFEHLWLLDPGWDRVSARVEMEKTLTEHLKKVAPDSTGARLDITYRASSGRHIVVELKKPTKTSLNYYELYEQVAKYKDAVEAYYRDKEPNKPVPPLDIYLLLAKTPTTFDEAKRRSLMEVSGRIITYEQIINDAKNAYQDYLKVNGAMGSLEALLRKLE